jgi:hypothetical protein
MSHHQPAGNSGGLFCSGVSIMAITIQAQLSKKVPGEIDFSSKQASITITAEVGDPTQIVAEAQRLYAIAEQAVDHQLALVAAAAPAVPPAPARPTYQPQGNAQQHLASRAPNAGRPAPRRGIPACSDAQKRLLDRLLSGDPQQADAVCQRAGVTTIDTLNMKQASEAIDWLKSQAVPA